MTHITIKGKCLIQQGLKFSLGSQRSLLAVCYIDFLIQLWGDRQVLLYSSSLWRSETKQSRRDLHKVTVLVRHKT